MSQPYNPQPVPDSIILQTFDGLKNTVARERLGPKDLETAQNIDLDDTGQVRRRRGFTQVDSAEWHSIWGPTSTSKHFGVRNGVLGIIRSGGSFYSLGINIGATACCFTEVNQNIYFSSADMSGIVAPNETVSPWGTTDGQGFWDSPVYTPTDTLGEVGGRYLNDPPVADVIEAFHGRIYLGCKRTIWKTILYGYSFVDKNAGFYQFEDDITMIRAVDDGIYVGTKSGLYFMQEERILMREFKSLKLDKVLDIAVLRGSDVVVPLHLVHPNAMQQATPTGVAIVFYTNAGIMAAFNGGEIYNMTQNRFILPGGVSAAGLFRQDQGANTFVVTVDSAGAPSANARIGDFIDAEIIRAVDRQGG